MVGIYIVKSKELEFIVSTNLEVDNTGNKPTFVVVHRNVVLDIGTFCLSGVPADKDFIPRTAILI